jgi:hypothetical protein
MAQLSRFGLGTIALLFLSFHPAWAGVPCDISLYCDVNIDPPSTGCQYRFNAVGSLDVLTVRVTLRDCFEVPVADCFVDVTIQPASPTDAFCSCEPVTQQVQTDSNGGATVAFDSIGGRGNLKVCAVAVCLGNIPVGCDVVSFTSPDLNASCEDAPLSSTNVIDLGIWASGLSTYQQASDYNCDGTVTVVDLGIWASGLGQGCSSSSR